MPAGRPAHALGAALKKTLGLLDSGRAMTPLRAVQTNDRATVDVGAYYRGLRDDQILYAHPFEGMSVDEVLSATRGGDRTVICAEPQAVEHLLLRHPARPFPSGRRQASFRQFEE